MVTCEDLAQVSKNLNVDLSVTVATLVACFSTIAFAFAIDVTIQALYTFKKYRGLYFWSLNVSNLGIVLHAASFCVKWLGGPDTIPLRIGIVVLICIGWSLMVTGQSLVLYSRLHLLCPQSNWLRWILIMICLDAAIIFPPSLLFFAMTNFSSSTIWSKGFNVMEKVQMVIFFVQEATISTLYIFEARRALRPRKTLQPYRFKKIMITLLIVNIMVIAADVALVSTELASLYIIESGLKPAIYAFKLRMEFPILNQLTALFTETATKMIDTTTANSTELKLVEDHVGKSRALAKAVPPPPSPEMYHMMRGHEPRQKEPALPPIEETGQPINNAILQTTEVRLKEWPRNKEGKGLAF